MIPIHTDDDNKLPAPSRLSWSVDEFQMNFRVNTLSSGARNQLLHHTDVCRRANIFETS